MKFIFLVLLTMGVTTVLHAQNVGIGTLTPHASAQLDISSTTQGLLIPRLTLVQRNAIASPATGLMIYQTDNTTGLYTYNGAGWQAVSGGGGLTIPFSSLYGGSSTAFEIDMIGGLNNTGIKSQTFNVGSKAFFGEARGNNSIGGYFTVAGTPTGAAALQTDIGDVYLASISGNVGINVTGVSVTEKLHVDGNLKLGNSTWSGAANDRLIKFGDGNFVSIGETGQDDRMTFGARNFIFTPTSSYPGYIGINTTAPSAPLSFGNIIGEKINMWNTDATHNYGMGVQGGLLQIHSNDASADIAFGYGSSSAFTQNVRMKGNGNIAVGGAVWSSAANDRVLNFGDGDFVHIGEAGADDRMELKASRFLFTNGSVQIQDGTQGANKVFVSDAAGTGTWTDLVQPLTNSERFKINGAGAVNLGGGNYVADFTGTLYNYSGNIVIDHTANSVTFNKAGLYRLEFANHVASSLNTGETVCYLEISGIGEYEQYIQLKVTGTGGEVHFTSDRYMPAGAVLRIYYSSTTAISFYDNYLAGYLIAE